MTARWHNLLKQLLAQAAQYLVLSPIQWLLQNPLAQSPHCPELLQKVQGWAPCYLHTCRNWFEIRLWYLPLWGVDWTECSKRPATFRIFQSSLVIWKGYSDVSNDYRWTRNLDLGGPDLSTWQAQQVALMVPSSDSSAPGWIFGRR